jgi:hypothetical protein
MIRRRAQAFFLLSVVVSIGGLSLSEYCQHSAHGAESTPVALMVYPNATLVVSDVRGPTDDLDYHVQAKFPASGVIGWISSKLQEKGWEPLAYDYLNPASPSSQVNGWQEFLDQSKNPTRCVHQWLGDWKDSSGNIVGYAFRYEQSDCNASTLTDLEVAAVYTPAAIAKQTQQAWSQGHKAPSATNSKGQ